MPGSIPHVQAGEALLELRNRIVNETDFQESLAALIQERRATFDGVWGSACALLAAALVESNDSITLVVPTVHDVDQLSDDLETFTDVSVERLPILLSSPGGGAGVDLEYGERLRMTKAAVRGQLPKIVLAPVAALLQPVPAPEDLLRHSRIFRVGQQVEPRELAAWLTANGFHSTHAVELPGEFAMRGGILDIFSPDWSDPVRIEFFDDEIESLRFFATASQRSLRDVQEIELSILDRSHRDRGCFVDLLPADRPVVILEQEKAKEEADAFLARHDDATELFGWENVQSRISERPLAVAGGMLRGYLGRRYDLASDSIEPFSGDLAEIRMQVDRVSGDDLFHAVARTEGEIPRVLEILKPTRTAQQGRLRISVGCVHQGFRLRRHGVCVVGCDQLFHRTDLRRGKRRHRSLGKAIDSFLDLKVGDLVVHLSHGIARFRGLKMLDKDGQHTEHLELEFHGGTKIYVPASKIDLVQKYIGGTKTRPRLATIGGKSWVKQRRAAEQAVTDLAAEMLEIQARRAARPGIAFGQDTEWQLEFEQSFPFTETPDQLRAIAEIKQDMQQPRPMDRLLCGDVGFGKTEVAMRAAFKAVANGYQVAVLVPTTILAEQHYRTFKERMSEFPLDIAKLSRFCSREEMKSNLERLKMGQVDIVIGTHRLVSKDVRFYNLGMVIIDEEQRFGVAHKERLKQFRESVDVLTMSATPIPRTLHMSLVGVRDISNLETAPEERIAVETRVSRFDPELIRSAILRELDRGGQVFFVHNRVGDIQMIKAQLQAIVPEASIGVGHGQMHEDDLEEVMTDFIHGRYDVLLATTIIESGLDIPNANTIFVNDADRFGLSDLHQLRGRVGRYKNRAYCYLMIQPGKHVTPLAAKRLQAIETYSEMGAGFAISMRDLEIRGAGNLLGTQQSGHIAAIGYELYCQMLENAVRELKNEPRKMSIHVDVDLPAEAYLPDAYVPSRRHKIDLYRRLTRLERFDQVQELRDEMLDRFGPLPPPARRLLALSEIRLEASIWQIASIFLQENYLGFRYLDRGRIDQLSKLKKGIIRVVDNQKAFVTLKTTRIPPDHLISLVKSILQTSD